MTKAKTTKMTAETPTGRAQAIAAMSPAQMITEIARLNVAVGLYEQQLESEIK